MVWAWPGDVGFVRLRAGGLWGFLVRKVTGSGGVSLVAMTWP